MRTGSCWFCPMQSPQYLEQFLLQSRHWENFYRVDEWISRIYSGMVKNSGYISIVKNDIGLNLQYQLFWWSTAGWATLWILDLMTLLSLSSRNTKHRNTHTHTPTHTHTATNVSVSLETLADTSLDTKRFFLLVDVCLFSLTYNTVTSWSCSYVAGLLEFQSQELNLNIIKAIIENPKVSSNKGAIRVLLWNQPTIPRKMKTTAKPATLG